MTLASQLQELERSQLVLQTDDPLMAYIFKHALVQDTTYATLLKNDRQRLHQSVAECIERDEPHRLDENAARLEQHYAAAGDHVKALGYARRAGDYATRMFANTEAAEHYTFALEILNRHGGSADEYRSVYLDRGRALQEMGAFEQALENYAALESLGRTKSDAALELAGLVERATLHAIPSSVHNPTLAADLNKQALTLARAQGDRRAECKTLWNLLLVAYFELEPVLAVEYGERALGLARELGWQEMEAYILNDMCRPLISIGPPERVLQALEEAHRIFEQQHNLPMLADNLAACALANTFYGNYEAGLKSEVRAVDLARTINSPWALGYACFTSIALAFNRGQIAQVHEIIRELQEASKRVDSIVLVYGTRGWLSELEHLVGNTEKALAHSRDLAEWAMGGYPLLRAWTLGNLVRDLARANKLDEAAITLEQAYREKPNDFYAFGPTAVARGEAELALALGDAEWALRAMNEHINRLEQLGIEFYLPVAYMLRGQALARLGRLDQAFESFAHAYERGERIPARITLWETDEAWANALDGCGDAAHARERRTRAAGHVMYIADQWETPVQRQQFLNQPRVRSLFESIAVASA